MIEAIMGLGGVVLIAAIVSLLFIEEMGVPLPFAPGDLLLTVGGIAIAAGRIDAVAFVVAAFAAIVGGAMTGRELFGLLGWQRLLQVARRVHAEKALDRVADLLHRNGWRGVFLARLIPGLRVHTTQIAGVSGMPRHHFFLGVVPASAVYVAAFVGLGAAVGRPALQLVHEGEHMVFVTLLFVGATVVLLLLRHRILKTAEYLELADWRGAFLRRPSLAGLGLIPVAIGLDYAGRALAAGLQLPLFLDSTGTILVAVLAGPWVGGAAGLAANLIISSTVDPIAAPYSIVSLALGFAAGLAARRNWRRQVRAALVLWGLCFLVATVGSTPINLYVHGGRSGIGFGDALYSTLMTARVPGVVAAFLGEAAVDLPDKLITVLAALLIYRALPGGGRAFRAMSAPRPPRPASALVEEADRVR